MAQLVKNLSTMQDTRFDPWVWKIPLKRDWLPTPVFLPGEFHGQRSLVGVQSMGCKESDMTECTFQNNWGRGSGPVKKNHGKFGESKYTAQSMGVLGKKSIVV